jgi:hypothetical protein
LPKSSDKNRRAGQGSKSRSGFLDFEERIKQRAEKEKERPPISKPQLVNMGFGDS